MAAEEGKTNSISLDRRKFVGLAATTAGLMFIKPKLSIR